MKIIPSSRKNRYIARVIILLAAIALIVWLVSWLSARYNLTISSTEGGEVTTPGEGTFTYHEGTVVNLVAEAEEGYYFVNWTGDVSAITDVNADATSITMNAQYSINANFGLKIRDWYDLDTVRDNLDGHHFLMNDLDSTTPGYEELASLTANGGKGWEPIGILGGITSFTGTFDGQGHEIRDLFVNRPDQIRIGLLGMTDYDAVVKNLGVVNVTVIGGRRVGGLVGLNKGTISNSYSTGSVTGHDEVGGLVGEHSWGALHNCYSIASVTGGTAVGGLVGRNDATTIDYSYCRGTISDSYSRGTVTGLLSVGGLVGATDHGIMVQDSYSDGSVTGNTHVGGLVASNEFSNVSNSYSSAEVTGREQVGGLVGYIDDGTVSNSYSTGSVTGDEYVGGLVGRNDHGTVSGSFWDIETSGQATSVGGTGKDTTELQDIATFSGATWDIAKVRGSSERNTGYIWNIVDDQTYPFLSWEP